MTALLALALAANLPAPLTAYLQSATQNNHTLGITRAQLQQQQAAVRQALAGLTPNLQIQGSYTRNQYNAVLAFPNSLLGLPGPGDTVITVQPYDQLNGTIGLNVPLLVPGAIARYAEGRHGAAGSEQAEAASELEVQLGVAQAYYQVVAAQGVVAAAQRSLLTANDALKLANSKLAAGTANQLNVERAKVDVARAEQQIADGVRVLGIARRSLETLSGQPVTAPFPDVQPQSLPTRAEQDFVDAALSNRPETKQAQEAIAQAQATHDEAWTQLAPSLVGQAQEHLTNYSGFVGHEGYWTLGVNLNWTLDPVAAPAALSRANGAIAEQQAHLAQVQDTVRDEVHTAWLTVTADKTHVEETTAEVQSAHIALNLTREQFEAGTATSLDLSQAERDSFSAEVDAAQSAADLATALLSLQKASGEPLLAADK